MSQTPPEIHIRPGLTTTLLFGEHLRLTRMDVEAREHFERVIAVPNTLLLQPSAALNVEQRLKLRVYFARGTAPESADFLLVVHPEQAEQQINVDLVHPVAEICRRDVDSQREETHRCQVDLVRARQKPEGLTSLLVQDHLNPRGVVGRQLLRGFDFTQTHDELLEVWNATSYRAHGVVALDLGMINKSGRAWLATEAELVGESGERLRILSLWPPDAVRPGADTQRVVVEAEATEAQAQGRFTLQLGEEGQPPSVILSGVSFP